MIFFTKKGIFFEKKGILTKRISFLAVVWRNVLLYLPLLKYFFIKLLKKENYYGY